MTYAHEHQKIGNPADLARIIQSILDAADYCEQDQEHFWAIGLDNAHKIQFIKLVALGSLNEIPIHPREVFRMAIGEGCADLIVAHNHPSGKLQPSPHDTKITKRLKDAGEIIGIQVLDHVIVTQNGHYSMAEHGLL